MAAIDRINDLETKVLNQTEQIKTKISAETDALKQAIADLKKALEANDPAAIEAAVSRLEIAVGAQGEALQSLDDKVDDAPTPTPPPA